MNLFNILPNNFFSVLIGPNKKIYSDTLNVIWKKTSEDYSFNYSRSDLVLEIVELLENSQSSDFLEETLTEKANAVIRRLKETGWIQEGLNVDYSKTVFFTSVALPFLNAIEEIHTNIKEDIVFDDEHPKVYTYQTKVEAAGYANTIYMLLKNKSEVDKATLLIQIVDNTKRLLNSLKSLNFRIKDYSDKVKRISDIDTTIKDFFIEYTEEILNKNFHKIKTLEHISKYRSFIIEKLAEKFTSTTYINEVSNLLLSNEYCESLDEAIVEVKQMLMFVIDTIQNIDDIIHAIEAENYFYTSIILKKTKFVLKMSDNTEGNLKSILRQYSKLYENDTILPSIINISRFGHFEASSLYKPRTTNVKTTKRASINNVVKHNSPKILEKIKFYEHSMKAINMYVLNLFTNKSVLKTKDIPLATVSDFIKFIYIIIYANESKKYYLKYKDQTVNVSNVTFRDVEVRKR